MHFYYSQVHNICVYNFCYCLVNVYEQILSLGTTEECDIKQDEVDPEEEAVELPPKKPRKVIIT